MTFKRQHTSLSTITSFIFILLLAHCAHEKTYEIASMKCDSLPTKQEISDCKEKKQVGSKYYLDEATKQLIQGNKFESINVLDKAISLDPKTEKPYFDKGLILASVGETNSAIEQYDKVIELNPDYAMAYHYKAQAMLELHKYREAIPLYIKTIELQPDYAMAHYELAEVYLDYGNSDKAVKSYRDAYNIWTNNLKENPAFFVQQDKLEKKFNKAKRFLINRGELQLDHYRLTSIDSQTPETSSTHESKHNPNKSHTPKTASNEE